MHYGLYQISSSLNLSKSTHVTNYSYYLNASTQQENIKPDILQSVIHTLQISTRAMRANRFGAQTLKFLCHLNNPFVSESQSIQERYRSAFTRQFVATTDEDWTSMARAVARALKTHMRCKKGSDDRPYLDVALKDAVRDATLAAILQALFRIQDINSATLNYISTEIHDLIVAKGCFDRSGARDYTDIPHSLRIRCEHLISTLRDVFSPCKESSPLTKALLLSSLSENDINDKYAEFNPLNVVIPAFEGPWRAVFYTILAVLQSPLDDCAGLLALRDSLPERPPSPAALSIVYESLRLYPPIRRVRRAGIQVDIESLQRNEKYWGPTALKFDPSRFWDRDDSGKLDHAKATAANGWMPFIVGSMKCPAAGGYSTRLMVVIAGEFLRQMFPDNTRPSWKVDGKEWDENAKGNDLLRAGRQEYEFVRLRVEKS
jgi:hypothetical protein